jgi:protein gp37
MAERSTGAGARTCRSCSGGGARKDRTGRDLDGRADDEMPRAARREEAHG